MRRRHAVKRSQEFCRNTTDQAAVGEALRDDASGCYDRSLADDGAVQDRYFGADPAARADLDSLARDTLVADQTVRI